MPSPTRMPAKSASWARMIRPRRLLRNDRTTTRPSTPQAVAHPAHGLDQLVLGVAELAPEVPDVDLDVVLVVELVAPDLIQDEPPREHAAGVADEEQEQLVLLDGQLDGGAVHRHDPPLAVDS